MKTWFPLTDYDFYAYVSAGIIVIAAIDYTLFDAVLVGRSDWTVVQGLFWGMLSYLAGYMLAGPSFLLIQDLVFRKVFEDPTEIILGRKVSRKREKVIKWFFASEYSAFPPNMNSRICQKLETDIGGSGDSLTSEEFFQHAFKYARYDDKSKDRLDSFMNNYGFSRNSCFAFLISTLLLFYRCVEHFSMDTFMYALCSLFLCLGMFGRYVKFHSCYTREVFRSFDRNV